MQFRSKELEQEFREKEEYLKTLKEAIKASQERVVFLERELYGIATGEILSEPKDFSKVFNNMTRWYKW